MYDIVNFEPGSYFEVNWWLRLEPWIPECIQQIMHILPPLRIKCGISRLSGQIVWACGYITQEDGLRKYYFVQGVNKFRISYPEEYEALLNECCVQEPPPLEHPSLKPLEHPPLKPLAPPPLT